MRRKTNENRLKEILKIYTKVKFEHDQSKYLDNTFSDNYQCYNNMSTIQQYQQFYKEEDPNAATMNLLEFLVKLFQKLLLQNEPVENVQKLHPG